MASIDSSFAESMKAQVLITSTSASSARAVTCIPCCRTLPSMISASTRFLAQPRLIIPTTGFEPVTPGPGTSADWTATLFEPHVAIATSDHFAVLPDFDIRRIEHFNRDPLPAELDGTRVHVNPAFKRRTTAFAVDCDPHERLAERPDIKT